MAHMEPARLFWLELPRANLDVTSNTFRLRNCSTAGLVGTAENNHGVFAEAASGAPVLFLIDEIDSLGAGRQDAVSDPGGAGREFNNMTMGR